MSTKRMKDTIPLEDWFHAAENLAEGEQCSIDHTNCTSGTDTRGRLYVKRIDSIVVVAYCHNCGLKGYCVEGHTNVNTLRDFDYDERGDQKLYQRVEVPEDTVFDWAMFPQRAKEWLTKYHIDPMTADKFLIGYSLSRRRLVLPMFEGATGLVSYQTRRLFDDDPYPKYLTYTKEGFSGGMILKNPQAFRLGREPVVICEDFISGVRLNHFLLPVVLSGAHFEWRERTWLGIERDVKILVWLDNDSDDIKTKAYNIARSLELCGFKHVKACYTLSDPKKYSDSELLNHLRNEGLLV